jgi:hypothetical protein
MTSSLRKVKVIFVLLALIDLLVGPWAGDAMGDDKRLSSSLTIEQIRDRVTQDIQFGMSLEAVDKYLTANAVEHGYYKDSDSVLAIIRNIRGSQFLIDKDAQIIVTLNEASKVSRIEVKPVFTGP